MCTAACRSVSNLVECITQCVYDHTSGKSSHAFLRRINLGPSKLVTGSCSEVGFECASFLFFPGINAGGAITGITSQLVVTFAPPLGTAMSTGVTLEEACKALFSRFSFCLLISAWSNSRAFLMDFCSLLACGQASSKQCKLKTNARKPTKTVKLCLPKQTSSRHII